MIYGFEDFLIERSGLLSGNGSCIEFARRLISFIGYLKRSGDEYADALIFKNEDCPFHDDNLRQCDYDVSGDNWSLPAWSDWEFVLHYGKIGGNTYGGTTTGMMENHMFIDNGDISDDELMTVILHEMKHYYDAVCFYNRTGSKMRFLGNVIDNINDEICEIEDENMRKFMGDFSYYFYITSPTELSAWLENTRMEDRTMIQTLDEFRKLIGDIIDWKDDESVSEVISSNYGVSFGSYAEFSNMMMDLFGNYLESRFGLHTFERYMKNYRKVVDRSIAKHMKVYAEGYKKNDDGLLFKD